MIAILGAAGVFAFISVVAAILATKADYSVQSATRTNFAILDAVREHSKTVGVAGLPDPTGHPYRALGTGGTEPTMSAEPPPMSTQILYVSSVHAANTKEAQVFLTKYAPGSNEFGRGSETNPYVTCNLGLAPRPGDTVEVVTRIKRT